MRTDMYIPEVSSYMYEALLPLSEAINDARYSGEAQARVFVTPTGMFVAAVCSELDEIGAALVVPSEWCLEAGPDSGPFVTDVHGSDNAILLPGLTDLAKEIAEEIWCNVSNGALAVS